MDYKEEDVKYVVTTKEGGSTFTLSESYSFDIKDVIVTKQYKNGNVDYRPFYRRQLPAILDDKEKTHKRFVFNSKEEAFTGGRKLLIEMINQEIKESEEWKHILKTKTALFRLIW